MLTPNLSRTRDSWPIASANLNLVRSICAAWELGDYGPGEWEHPAIEFTIVDGPTPGTWTGAAGIREGWGDFLRSWEGFRHEAVQYRELDSERVFVLFRFGGRGKMSGLEVAQITAKAAGLFHVREGKVTRIVLYFDSERAFTDLGIGPEAGSPAS